MGKIIGLLMFPLYIMAIFGALIPFIIMGLFRIYKFTESYDELYYNYLKIWKD